MHMNIVLIAGIMLMGFDATWLTRIGLMLLMGYLIYVKGELDKPALKD